MIAVFVMVDPSGRRRPLGPSVLSTTVLRGQRVWCPNRRINAIAHRCDHSASGEDDRARNRFAA